MTKTIPRIASLIAAAIVIVPIAAFALTQAAKIFA